MKFALTFPGQGSQSVGMGKALADAYPAAAAVFDEVDTALGELITDRDALNAEIDTLRLGRDHMSQTDYQSALLDRMLELARVEDAIEARQDELDANE